MKARPKPRLYDSASLRIQPLLPSSERSGLFILYWILQPHSMSLKTSIFSLCSPAVSV